MMHRCDKSMQSEAPSYGVFKVMAIKTELYALSLLEMTRKKNIENNVYIIFLGLKSITLQTIIKL